MNGCTLIMEEDIHKQLSEKDTCLTLAAEAGQVLLEKNQELKRQFDSLQEEYIRKIEILQQDRYQLKKSLTEQDSKHESCIQELHQEVAHLSGQLQSVKRSSRAIEHTTESTYESLAGQNSSLLQELENVKAYNKALSHQVQSLSSRFDQQDSQQQSVHGSNNVAFGDVAVDNNNRVGQDIQGLKETLKELIDQKDLLEESVSGLMKGRFDTSPHKDVNVSQKFSYLEAEMYSMREQMKICQEDLFKTRKKNEQLEDQLEECVAIQSGGTFSNASLLNELSESSIPEVDMNFRAISSTPRGKLDSSGSSDLIKSGLCEIYSKLSKLKNDLLNESTETPDVTDVSIDMVDHILDDVFGLVQRNISETKRGLDGSPEARSITPQQECNVLRQ